MVLHTVAGENNVLSLLTQNLQEQFDHEKWVDLPVFRFSSFFWGTLSTGLVILISVPSCWCCFLMFGLTLQQIRCKCWFSNMGHNGCCCGNYLLQRQCVWRAGVMLRKEFKDSVSWYVFLKEVIIWITLCSWVIICHRLWCHCLKPGKEKALTMLYVLSNVTWHCCWCQKDWLLHRTELQCYQQCDVPWSAGMTTWLLTMSSHVWSEMSHQESCTFVYHSRYRQWHWRWVQAAVEVTSFRSSSHLNWIGVLDRCLLLGRT